MEPQYYESYFEDSFVGQLKPGSGADGDAESIPDEDEDEDLHPSNIEFEFDSFGPESFIHTPATNHEQQQQQQTQQSLPGPEPTQHPTQESLAQQQPAMARSSAQYSSMRKRVPVNLSANKQQTAATTIDQLEQKSEQLEPTQQTLQEQEQHQLQQYQQRRSMRKRVPVNLSANKQQTEATAIDQLEQKYEQLEPTQPTLYQQEPEKEKENGQEKEQAQQEKEEQQQQPVESPDEPTTTVQWGDCPLMCTTDSIKQIDLKVIEPYKKIISHAGYCHSRPQECTATLSSDQTTRAGTEPPAIIVFSACHLPDKSRRDYCYVMDHLFLYVLTSLHELIADDYILIYLHNSCPDQNNLPTFGLLKRFYQMIDRKLRKNLKALYLVHPTFWLKTLVIMSRPFISSKFSRKIHFIQSIDELGTYLPLEKLVLPTLR